MTHPTSNDDYYEHRITRLEAVYENVGQTLVRLESKMDEGFKFLNTRIDKSERKMDEGFNAIYTRIDRVELRIDRVESKMDDGFKLVHRRIDNIESKIERVETKTDRIHDRIFYNMYWIMGGFAAILGVIARSQHWI